MTSWSRLALFAGALALAGCSGLREPPGPERAAAVESPVAAITVSAPDWRPGETWRYSDGYGFTVERVEGPVTTFRRLDDTAQWFERQGFRKGSSQTSTTLRKILFEDLPAGAGAALTSATPLTYRREYGSAGDVKAHATSWTVEGRERVKVPAGEFDCIILVMRTRSLGSEWTGFERWWYSPEVRSYVRLEYKYGAVAGSRVLLSYSPTSES